MFLSSTNIESLPDEVIFNILVRLQADDIYEGARVVCRRWYNIIHSDAFINTHFEQYSTNYGLLLSEYGSMNKNRIFVSATKQGQIDISESSCKCRSTARASCNGLVLEYSLKTASPYILNPATKQALFLLPPFEFDSNLVYGSCGIAYSAASMEYKLVQSRKGSLMHLDVLTVGVDNSWRAVQVEHLPDRVRELFNYTPLVTEDFMHWTSGTERVLTMNMENEIITETNVPLPQVYRAASTHKYYLSTGRYLTLLVGRRDYLMWKVWEMKPAESGEWRKQTYNIKFEAQKLQQFEHCDCEDGVHHSNRHHVLPLGWVKYPEVCAFRVYWSRTLILYNLRTHEIDSTRELPCCTNEYKAFPHRNTLVGLN